MLHDPSPVHTLPDHNIVPRMTSCTVSNVTAPNPGATYSVPIHTSCCFPTPINTSRLSHLLKSHPDQSFVSYVCNGLSSGFRIEYSAPLSATPVIAPNLATADSHCDHITTYLQKCCQTQETAGPFTSMPFPAMHCSGLGVVPKKNGKLRVIHHLSAPPGASVNDGIQRTDVTLRYITIDHAINAVLRHGRGALLSKFDVRNAFRLIPVHPADHHFLGICWQGQYYYDRVLPFGLRSSPYIFDRVATALEWILRIHIATPDLIHYLDDFLTVAASHLPLASTRRDLILRLFEYLGVPLATDKLEGPCTCLTFLGITLDTERMEARLPTDKLAELRLLLTQLGTGPYVSQGKLASFLGKLSFASAVVIPGRTFTRRLWDVHKRFQYQRTYFRIKLDAEAKKDIHWWRVLLEHWNGKSFFHAAEHTSAEELGLYTDASSTIGWGAFYGTEGRWIYGQWADSQRDESIEFKELYAILLACSTWGHMWSRRRIRLHCDNMSVVACLANGTSKAPRVMSLIRSLFLVCATSSFTITACHVPGHCNEIADSLSRSNLQAFVRLAPEARPRPDQEKLPPSLD